MQLNEWSRSFVVYSVGSPSKKISSFLFKPSREIRTAPIAPCRLAVVTLEEGSAATELDVHRFAMRNVPGYATMRRLSDAMLERLTTREFVDKIENRIHTGFAPEDTCLWVVRQVLYDLTDGLPRFLCGPQLPVLGDADTFKAAFIESKMPAKKSWWRWGKSEPVKLEWPKPPDQKELERQYRQALQAETDARRAAAGAEAERIQRINENVPTIGSRSW